MKASVPTRVVSTASPRDWAWPNSAMTGSKAYGLAGSPGLPKPTIREALASDERPDLVALCELRIERRQAGEAAGIRVRVLRAPRPFLDSERVHAPPETLAA